MSKYVSVTWYANNINMETITKNYISAIITKYFENKHLNTFLFNISSSS